MDSNGRPVLPGLSYGAKAIRMEADRSGSAEGVSGLEGQRSGASLGQVWGVSGGGLGKESPAMTRAEGAFSHSTRRCSRSDCEIGPAHTSISQF